MTEQSNSALNAHVDYLVKTKEADTHIEAISYHAGKLKELADSLDASFVAQGYIDGLNVFFRAIAVHTSGLHCQYDDAEINHVENLDEMGLELTPYMREMLDELRRAEREQNEQGR